MKTNIRTIIGIAFASVLVLTVSCKGKTEENKEPAMEETMDHKDHDMGEMGTADKQGKEYTSKYVCPMHCEGSGSDTEDKCPVCGMAYVLNEDYHEGHGEN